MFSDFPFECELTENAVWILQRFRSSAITGYCSGDVIGRDPSEKLFFRAGYASQSISEVMDEKDILSKLQCYDFVPRIICLKAIGRYIILFTECIEGSALDDLSSNDPRLSQGVIEALMLLYTLYDDIGFTHGDMGLNNIMIDENDKIYLIDFTESRIPPTIDERGVWTYDFQLLARDLLIKLRRKLLDDITISLADQLGPESYLKHINRLEAML